MKTSKEKRKKIKESLLKTREKRKKQCCKVYTLKIDSNHLNKIQKEWLKRIFIEAKWFYNYILSQEDIFNIGYLCKNRKVQVKIFDKFESRELLYLSSQMKSGLYNRIKEAIIVLSKLKKINFKIGKLKFKPEINSIDLSQYNNTWRFKNKNRIQIQGLKHPLKVLGIEQIPEDIDFANARIIRKSSGYYIQITTFQNKQNISILDNEVGLDFGIKTTIATSDGEKFNIKVPETTKLKKLQKYLSRKTNKKSKRRIKNIIKIKKEYEKISNQKKDQVNKLISYLKNKYKIIYIQDEQIKNWQKGLFGKNVQHSSLGAIKSRLKKLESVRVISKREPTTKLCSNCGALNDISLSQRTYRCSCGYQCDRDIHAAKNILLIGKNKTNSVTVHNSTISENKTSEPFFSENDLSYDSLKIEAINKN